MDQPSQQPQLDRSVTGKSTRGRRGRKCVPSNRLKVSGCEASPTETSTVLVGTGGTNNQSPSANVVGRLSSKKAKDLKGERLVMSVCRSCAS